MRRRSNDRPIRLHYAGLDPHRRYRLIATYAGEDYTLPMTLTANGRYTLQSAFVRTSNPMTVEIAIPPAATAGGTLDLAGPARPAWAAAGAAIRSPRPG